MTEEPGRGSHLSVSSVKLADKCSLAWRYHYVDGLPAPEEAAAMVFGTVVHNGVEQWYDLPGTDNHRNTSLRNYVHKQWFEHLPRDVAIELRKCIAADKSCEDLVQLILINRPTLKAPRTCKEFEISDQKKVFDDCKDGLLKASRDYDGMRWPKDENAHQAYNKSIFIANQLEKRWKEKPRPLVVEREFVVEFSGIEIRGRIDQVRADPNPMGEVQIEGLDIKTGRQMMTQMEAFLQWFLYNEACYQIPDLPIPDYWTYFMARHNKPQHGRIDRDRHAKLAERILDRVKKQIQSGDYAPQYSMMCRSCDFKGICEQEISVWEPGEEGLVLDGVA